MCGFAISSSRAPASTWRRRAALIVPAVTTMLLSTATPVVAGKIPAQCGRFVATNLEVDDEFGLLGWNAPPLPSVPDSLVGTYTLSHLTPDLQPYDFTRGVYWHRQFPFVIQVNVPDAGDSFGSDAANIDMTHRVHNEFDGATDLFEITSLSNRRYNTDVVVDSIVVKLVDGSGSAFSDDLMLLSPPDLNNFDSEARVLLISGHHDITGETFRIQAELVELAENGCSVGFREMRCVDYQGQIIAVNDPSLTLAGSITPGDDFDGRYVFDLEALDGNGDPAVGEYGHLLQVYGMQIDIMGHAFVSDPANVDFLVSVLNDVPGDVYRTESPNNTPFSNDVRVDSLLWVFRDDNGTAVESDSLFGPPAPGNWPDLNEIRIVGAHVNGEDPYEIIGQVMATLSLPCDAGVQSPTDASGGSAQRLSSRAAPNPFVGSTQIHYGLTRAGPAEVVIFDVRGRAVRTLVRGAAAPGQHVAVWDGRVGNGERAPTGVYYFRVRTPGAVHIGRMLLLR